MKPNQTEHVVLSGIRSSFLKRASALTVAVPAAVACPAPAARVGFCSPDFRQHQCRPPNQHAGTGGKSEDLFMKTRSSNALWNVLLWCLSVLLLTGASHAQPMIMVQPQSRTVPAGSSVTFTVTASGSMPLSYQWRFNGTPIPSATSFSYTVVNAQCGHRGAYSVRVSNPEGSATSIDAILKVEDTTPPVITCPPAVTVLASSRAGAAANFTVTANDACDPAPTITCEPGSGSPFPIGTTPVRCTAKDASGNVATCGFAVQVVEIMARKGSVEIIWAIPGAVLEAADELAGPWTSLPEATSPYSAPTGSPRKFYRLRYP